MKREANLSEQGSGNTNSAGADRNQIVDLDFLRGLIAAVDDSGIDSLEISRGGTRIRVAKTPAPGPVAMGQAPANYGAQGAAAPAPAAPSAPPPSTGQAGPPEAAAAKPAAASNLVDIKSPMVGTFYRSPNPDSPSYVEVGSRITKGQTLCILEAMKLMNELEAEVEGTVREICVENAEPVEYGQVLFRIEPAA